MGGACSTHGRGEERIHIFVVKSEWKRPHGRYMCRWEDNFGMGLTGIGWKIVD
jgi:hypothetical protein